MMEVGRGAEGEVEKREQGRLVRGLLLMFY